MELPDDVLALIRAYSKPSFSHFREYNNVLKLNHLDEWTTLKEKLKDNDHVLPLLLAYQKSSEDWHQSMKEEHKMWESGYMGFNMTVIRAERARRKEVSLSKKYTMQKRLRALTRELYGIEKESYEMRDNDKLGVWK